MNGTPTYPGDRSNEAQPNSEVFRDIVVINQPAGGVEFVNTKDDEMLTVYYKNGSFMRFNKLSSDTLNTQDKREHTMGDDRLEILGNQITMVDKNREQIVLGDEYIKTGDVDKWQYYNQEYKKAIRPIHNIKRLFEIQRVGYANYIDHAPTQQQSGSFADCPVEKTEGKFIYTVDPIIYTPATKEAGKHTIAEFTNPAVQYKSVKSSGDYCATCGGTHKSPSSQDGSWTLESTKNQITQKRVELQDTLMEIEKHLGQNKNPDGGSRIDKISKDLVQIVGLVMNDFESFRRDEIGKLVPCGMKIDPLGGFITAQYRASPLVEQVHVDRMPGGSFDHIIGDSYNLTVGANGINIKTFGPMEVYAPTIVTTAEDLQYHSRGDFNVSAQRIDFNADTITIRPNKKSYNGGIEEQQLFVDANLQIGNNLIVRGGAHIEGELTVQHITAPLEIGITDECFEWGEQTSCEIDTTAPEDCQEPPTKSPVFADIVKGCTIGWNRDDLYLNGQCSDGATCITFVPKHTIYIESILAPNAVAVHPHFHQFPTLPMRLIAGNTDVQTTVNGQTYSGSLDPNSAVRAIGAANNFVYPVQPLPVQNATSNTSVTEKFGGVCEPLTLNEGAWQTANVPDTLPDVEGVRSAKYSDQDVANLIAQLEAKFESRYQELQKKLESLVTA